MCVYEFDYRNPNRPIIRELYPAKAAYGGSALVLACIEDQIAKWALPTGQIWAAFDALTSQYLNMGPKCKAFEYAKGFVVPEDEVQRWLELSFDSVTDFLSTEIPKARQAVLWDQTIFIGGSSDCQSWAVKVREILGEVDVIDMARSGLKRS